jgi:UDP-glucose-4-epimerase GalE
MTRVVLVTGGAGYVGSHAAKALAAAGYTPVTLDNLERGHRWAVRWGPLEQGDLLDRAFVEGAIAKWRPEAVMHFAGLIAVGESVTAPDLYYRNNVVGSLHLLEAMQRFGVDRIVFSSTAAVYGAPDIVPIPETAPCRPVNPYGVSKWMVEMMLADFGAAYGLRSMALRYFNAAGADPDGDTGEAHDPETHLIPLALAAALGQNARFAVHGEDYKTPDGTCVRDYIHVTDLAAAHVLALDALAAAPKCTHHAYNLGTGAGASVRQVLAAVEKVTGRRVPAASGPRRPGDSPELVADPLLAKTALGWIPTLSGLESIVRTAWNWSKS